MTTRALFVVTCTLLMLIVSLSGCGSKAKESGPESATTSGTAAPIDGTDRQASDMQKMKTELAKLTSSDAASAAKQHHCPVSGKMLGTMGAPKKVDVQNRSVWICCDGCREELLTNPDKYLAELK
ncbi:MAG: hypothetical protein JNM18_04615 [Planctomycetaceae bacterium]|nr:hypothetical protein [Planctomycetaceae bacterium]